MSSGEKIWIAQNGQRTGPFTEEDVRRAIADGHYGPDTLVWRKGMPEWAPLFSVFPKQTATPAPAPPAAAAAPPQPKATPDSSTVFHAEDRPGSSYSYEERAQGPGPSQADHAPRDNFSSNILSRRDLPTPPSLHWGLVFLFSILTLGIFAIVWPFIQANWVRKIDSDSKATPMLAGSLICLVASSIVSEGNRGSALGILLWLVYLALWLVAYYAMADSIRRKLAEYALPVEIGGITLFFFNTFYLQGQLSWIARWKETGSRDPKPSKGLFYVLMIVPFVLVLAAIAIPQYQTYVKRVQAMEAQRGE